MDTPVKLIDGNLVCFKENHNELVKIVVMDDQVSIFERLLCCKCFEAKQQVYQYLSIEEAQQLINEKLYKLNDQQKERKKDTLRELNEFQNKFMKIRSKVIEQINEILRITEQWITDISNIGQKGDLSNFISDLEQFQSNMNIDILDNCNRSHFKKIDWIIQKLTVLDYYQSGHNQLMNIVNDNEMNQIIKKNAQKIEQIKVIEQSQMAYAISFNNSGSIMVAASRSQIRMWQFDSGKWIESVTLKGHNDLVYCFAFSKKHDWFASSGKDCIIRFWKNTNQNWVGSQPGKSHTDSVFCLILNNSEDQLLSCSRENSIKVWEVNYEYNQIQFAYTLENRHTERVYVICFNEQETALISCGYDKKIILWSKGQNQRWNYRHEIKMDDEGYRMTFINENQIAWQQCHKGIIHILECNNGKLEKRPDLNLTLNQEMNDDSSLFPTIINRQRQIIIWRYNRYVYIVKILANGKLQIASEPIDCLHNLNFGALSCDGEYLVIWSQGTYEFRVYKIQYE